MSENKAALEALGYVGRELHISASEAGDGLRAENERALAMIRAALTRPEPRVVEVAATQWIAVGLSDGSRNYRIAGFKQDPRPVLLRLRGGK